MGGRRADISRNPKEGRCGVEVVWEMRYNEMLGSRGEAARRGWATTQGHGIPTWRGRRQHRRHIGMRRLAAAIKPSTAGSPPPTGTRPQQRRAGWGGAGGVV